MNYLIMGLIIGVLSILIAGNYNLVEVGVEGLTLNDSIAQQNATVTMAKDTMAKADSTQKHYQASSDKAHVMKTGFIEPFDQTSCQSNYSNLGTNGQANRLNNVMCNIQTEQKQKNGL